MEEDMAEYTITDPEFVARKNVDGQGRVYIGKEYAKKEVRIVVEEIEDGE